MGSNSDGFTASYTLTGGTYSLLNGQNYTLGAGTGGITRTTLTLGGTAR